MERGKRDGWIKEGREREREGGREGVGGGEGWEVGSVRVKWKKGGRDGGG